MPRTTITSERAREIGRLGAAAVERDPVTKRFRRRDAPPETPATKPPAAATRPPADDPPAPPAAVPPEPAPSFRMARRLFGRKRAS